MKFASVRLVTNEFQRLVAFYQKLSGGGGIASR